jgi:hypothetical protein
VGTDKTGTCDGTYNALLPLTKNIFLVLKLFTRKEFTLLHSTYIGMAHVAKGKRSTSSALDVLNRD